VPDIERYENLVLGNGTAGKYLAWTLAKAGRQTAIVERKYLGGACPNIACLPSKNMIYSAKVASLHTPSNNRSTMIEGRIATKGAPIHREAR